MFVFKGLSDLLLGLWNRVVKCPLHSYFVVKLRIKEASVFWRTIFIFFLSVGDFVFCVSFLSIFNLVLKQYFTCWGRSHTDFCVSNFMQAFPPVAQLNIVSLAGVQNMLCCAHLWCSGDLGSSLSLQFLLHPVPARCADPDTCWLIIEEQYMTVCTYTVRGTLLSKLANSCINTMPSGKLTSYLLDVFSSCFSFYIQLSSSC